MHSLIKPLITDSLAHYIGVKLIKLFHGQKRGAGSVDVGLWLSV